MALAEQPGHHFEVLPAGHGRLDRCVLARQPDHLPHCGRLAAGVVAGHEEVAAVEAQQGRNRADERRLAGPVGPQEGDHLPWLGYEVEPVKGGGLPETLGGAAGLDGR